MNTKIQQNEIVAIEKGVKNRVDKIFTEIYKQIQKPSLFSGQIRKFEAKSDDEEQFPDESIKVQIVVSDSIKRAVKILTELFDVTATKDYGNCQVKADIIIDNKVIIESVPATYLLFLEKQLTDIHTFVGKIPTLDPAYDWDEDINSNLFKSNIAKTHKTKKVQKPIVKYDATKEHPAQTEMISEDVIIGYWNTTQLSGALQVPRKEMMLEKIEKLQKAVKSARERANSETIEKKEIGSKILNYIFE